MKQRIETEFELTPSTCKIHDKFDPHGQFAVKPKYEWRDIGCASGAFIIDFHGRLDSIIFNNTCRVLELKIGNVLVAINEYDASYSDWAAMLQPLPGHGLVALHSDSSKIGEFELRAQLLFTIQIEHFQSTFARNEKSIIANVTYTRDFKKEEEERCKAIQQ